MAKKGKDLWAFRVGRSTVDVIIGEPKGVARSFYGELDHSNYVRWEFCCSEFCNATGIELEVGQACELRVSGGVVYDITPDED